MANKVVRKDILEDVEEYLRLDRQVKDGEKRLRELRKRIEPYMHERELKSIMSSVGAIAIVPQPRAIISARYTTYEVDDILGMAKPDIAEQCIVDRVDKEAVEYLVKINKLPKEIESFKQMPITPCFSVQLL